MNKIRILIADDHSIVREGVRMILSGQRDFEVVGEAATGREALELARQLRPDVVVMDISMPDMTGIEATEKIRQELPSVQVLGLTMHEEPSYVFRMLRAGGAGYVLKRAAAEDLVSAVRAAHRGEAFLYPSVARLVVQDFLDRAAAKEEPASLDGLTPREREVLTLIAEGLTNQEIAKRLYISIKTVQTHRAHIMEKLNLHDRTELVRYAIRKGLIEA
ncbi:MAG: response regulator transcription factor [Armatimonadota bacterium]|nr:response regulator transcription factor [Armatimonadota bacterium]MDR5697777.1 response regulator transcription factor [Armatimonadota bacterium]